ncbi:MAG TPA: hypothetical protein VJ819_17035 [Nocardioidaceae bacterium]|nr:hypothetical protein [Nocardioidaceae bacterium]
MRGLRAVAAILLAQALLTSCSGDAEPQPPRPTPTALGGELGTPAVPPAGPMDTLEKGVARSLNGTTDLHEQDLRVDYLRCPAFDGRTPQTLRCTGFLEQVTADVMVRLTKAGPTMHFDARLGQGILSTANLVDRLAREGYRRIDCGDRPAYPSVVGSEITCAVTDGDQRRFVVATVTSQSGEVTISDY